MKKPLFFMATKWVKLFHKCIVLHCILSFLHLVVLEEICSRIHLMIPKSDSIWIFTKFKDFLLDDSCFTLLDIYLMRFHEKNCENLKQIKARKCITLTELL